MSRRRTSSRNIRNFIGTTSLRTSRPLSTTSMLPRVGVGGSPASTAMYFVPSVSYAIRDHRRDAAEVCYSQIASPSCRAKTWLLSTRMATPATPSRVRWLGVSGSAWAHVGAESSGMHGLKDPAHLSRLGKPPHSWTSWSFIGKASCHLLHEDRAHPRSV